MHEGALCNQKAGCVGDISTEIRNKITHWRASKIEYWQKFNYLSILRKYLIVVWDFLDMFSST